MPDGNFAIPRALSAAGWVPQAWLDNLPKAIAQLSGRWSLSVGQPYQPGGVTAWVAPAVDDAGRKLALKVMQPGIESRHEGAGLRAWDGDGAIRIFDEVDFDDVVALLLERCVPGNTLKSTLPEPEQDVVVAGLLKRTWRHPATTELRPLQDMCDYWADEFDAKLAANPGVIDAGLAREGMRLFRELPSSATNRAVLCTDLHAENILAAQREPWLVIDPKPHVGDPTYDPLQHMLNCPDRLAEDPLGFARRIAELCELDENRLRLWLFARCVQESIPAANEPWRDVDLREVAAKIRQ